MTSDLSLQASQSAEKAASIKSELISRINENCQDCRLTDDRIRNGQLDCFDSSLQTVTYRAEVHGTQDRNSEQILGEIGDLVRSDESLRVLSVTMSLVSTCQVRIDSLDEEKCESGGGETEGPVGGELPLIPIIVGGAVGGVSVVAVCCIVVVVMVLVRQRRRKKRGSIHRRK